MSGPRAPHSHANRLRENPEPATFPDIRAMCQDWGSITSPFAHRAAHVMSHASQSAEHEAEMSVRPLNCAGSRSFDGSGALDEYDSHADSISKMLEAVREADACRYGCMLSSAYLGHEYHVCDSHTLPLIDRDPCILPVFVHVLLPVGGSLANRCGQ